MKEICAFKCIICEAKEITVLKFNQGYRDRDMQVNHLPHFKRKTRLGFLDSPKGQPPPHTLPPLGRVFFKPSDAVMMHGSSKPKQVSPSHRVQSHKYVSYLNDKLCLHQALQKQTNAHCPLCYDTDLGQR